MIYKYPPVNQVYFMADLPVLKAPTPNDSGLTILRLHPEPSKYSIYVSKAIRFLGSFFKGVAVLSDMHIPVGNLPLGEIYCDLSCSVIGNKILQTPEKLLWDFALRGTPIARLEAISPVV